MIVYSVVSKEYDDDSGTTVHRDYEFDANKCYYTHMVQILRDLDFLGLELMYLTVTKNEGEENV